MDWKVEEDGVLLAYPQNLIQSYWIYPPDFELHIFVVKGSFQLEIIHNDDVDIEEITSHKSLEEAKDYAQNHYTNILLAHLA